MKKPLTPLSNIRIVLDHTSHPGNIGAAARALKTMGLQRLHLVEPRRFPHAEADALACDAKDVLQNAQVHTTLDEALTGCVFAAGLTARKRHMGHTCVDVREAAQRLMQIAATQEVALLFGNEAYGLSNDELSKCQLMISIPTDEAYTSLNVASAVQIMAYELRMAWLAAPQPTQAPIELARLDDIELFYKRLEETLICIQFLDPNNPKRLMPRVRRLFARTVLEKEELNILMGMLKSINLNVK
ncbi:MAG: RNA methyltransferase [Pseudomonadota bacterium]|mgnify:FL=1